MVTVDGVGRIASYDVRMASTDLDRAAAAVAGARALVFTAGAGMGVDSGLPDFRGSAGFWRAYPPYAKLGLDFASLANPRWFRADPELAWGFYGHRLVLYRRTAPHGGFALLRRWAERAPSGAFVFTSNIDGHFEVAGFDEAHVCECHGSIHWLQCTRACGAGVFSAQGFEVAVDEETFRAAPPLPACPRCGALARPAVLMFGDGDWDPSRTEAQERRLDAWLGAALAEGSSGVCVIECGAGTAIPTVRLFGERLARAGAALVRINAREAEVPAGPGTRVGLAMGALEALGAIHARLLHARRAR